jgi:hypothetical protein
MVKVFHSWIEGTLFCYTVKFLMFHEQIVLGLPYSMMISPLCFR